MARRGGIAKRSIIAVSIFVFGLCPAIVSAQDGQQMGGEDEMVDVEDEDQESYQEMLRLSAEGNELYEAGELSEAAQTYHRAYELYPQPILLKNEMITRYLLEECESAVSLGSDFLQTGEGTQEDKEDVAAVLGECSLELAEAAQAEQDWDQVSHWLDFGEPYFSEAELRSDADALRETMVAAVDDDSSEDEPTTVEPIDDQGVGTKTIGGYSLIGAGALALGGGLIWHLRWESQYSDLENLRDEATDDPDRRDDFIAERDDAQDSYSRVRWGVPMLYGIGAAATAAGVALLVWPSSPDGESTAMIRPVMSHDGAGAVFSLTF